MLSTLRTTGLFLCAVSLYAAPLPSAAAVLDRYVEVTGGRAAWSSKFTEIDEVEGRSLDDTRVVLRAAIAMSRVGNSLTHLTVPEEAQEGVFNGTAWALTKLSGARVKHDADRDEAIRSSRMLEEARWRALYPQSRAEAVETVAGRRCYRLALLPSPDRRMEWFDVSSGLLVRKSWRSTADYTFDVESWRTQEGLKQPLSWIATRNDFQYRLRVISVEYNRTEHFELPLVVGKAQEPGALPNAEELIERHIFESGGVEAYLSIRTQRVTGTLEFVDRNMNAQTETVSAGGGRYYQAVDVPGLGKTEQGSDGAVAWERSPVFGPRSRKRTDMRGLGVTLEAAEVVGWRYLLSSVETDAEETIDGRDCYRVHLKLRNGGDGGTRWYERKTGLLYRASATTKNDMGEVPTVLTYLEYRTVEGVKWPVRIRMAMGGQDVIFVARDVELNAPIDATVFAPPDELRLVACNQTVGCQAP